VRKKGKIFSLLLTMLFMSSIIITPGIAAYAESDDSEVVLFQDDFQDGDFTSPLWIPEGSNQSWNIKTDSDNKVLNLSKGDPEAFISSGNTAWTDYSVSMKFRHLSGGAYPGILARFKDIRNYYYFRLNPVSSNTVELTKRVNGTDSPLAKKTDYKMSANTWYTLKMVLKGSQIKCYINDVLIFDVLDTSLTAGKIGVRTNWGIIDMDDVKVTTSASLYTRELLEKTLQEVTLTPEQEAIYGPRGVLALKDSIAKVQELLKKDTLTVQEILEGYSSLNAAFAALKIVEDYDYVPVGQPWKDTDGDIIQAHGGGFLEYGGKYWWVGEDKAHNKATFNGVNLYSSTDLKNWKFEKTILTPSSDPALANCKVERPKLLYNEKTNKFVLWGHWETSTSYAASRLVVATSDTIDGDYEYIKHFRPGVGEVAILDSNGNPVPDPIDSTQIKSGYGSRDFTVFEDKENQKAYLVSAQDHEKMRVYPLTEDYADVDFENSYPLFEGNRREAPALVKVGEYYFIFTSGQSGWMPNQGMYAYTKDISDPQGWSELKLFGNNTTFYSQPTNVMTVTAVDGSKKYIYMGDRWNSKALGASSYVWLPLEITGTEASMKFTPEWSFDVESGAFQVPESKLVSEGKLVKVSGVSTDSPTDAVNYSPEKANDGIYVDELPGGDNSNYFKADKVPFTWQVDLENVYDLSRIDISFRTYNGSEAYYAYTVEGSNDEKTWTTILDESSNTTAGFKSNKLTGFYRYVRVSVSKVSRVDNSSSASWVRGLVEVQVYAKGTIQESANTAMTAAPFLLKDQNTVSNVKLQWTSVIGALRYEVSRSVDNGSYEVLQSVTGTSCDDYDLLEGKNYKYAVKAYNGNVLLATIYSSDTKAYKLPDNLKTFDNISVSALEMLSELKVEDTYYRFNYIGRTSPEKGFKELIQQTSKDGVNYGNDKVVLSYTDHPDLAACKFEATSIVYNEKTNRFIVWTHYENNQDYTLGRVAVASAVPGEAFTFLKSFRPLGNDSRDLGFFKNDDGSAYLISSTNTNADMIIYKLTEDWLDVEKAVTTVYKDKHREAPCMIKKDGVYYLFTSKAAGWYPSTSMYSSASSIEGPWSELREIGNTSTFSAQSGGLVHLKGEKGDNYAMMANRWMFGWKDATNPIHQQRMLPISFSKGYAFFDYYEKVLYSGEDGTIIPVQNGKLISQGKPATGSSNATTASYVNDGDYKSIWVAEKKWPTTWTVDLEYVHDLSEIQTSWFMYGGSEAYHQYKVEGSIDGVTYSTLLDKSSGYNDYGFTADDLSGKARFVRVTLVNAKLQNTPSNWYTPQLYEVKVFGHEDETAPLTDVKVLGTEQNGWYSTNATMELSASDDLSGVENTEYRIGESEEWKTYTEPVVFDKDGVYKIQYHSKDKAGNVEEIKEITIQIDKTAPTFTAFVGEKVLDNGISVDDCSTLFFKVEDNLSKVASAKITMAGIDYNVDLSLSQGVDIDLAGKVGQHIIAIEVIDNAGNKVVKELKFEVTTSLSSIRKLVDRYAGSNGLASPMLAQLINNLDQTQHQMDIGRLDQAAKHMEDFVKHLSNEALADKVSIAAKTVLNNDASSLIKLWSQNKK
jgi:hypothetical protein